MPKGLYLSHSGWQTHRECGKQYDHSYIHKTVPKTQKSKHNTLVGTSVQAVFEDFYNKKMWRNPATARSKMTAMCADKLREAIDGSGRGNKHPPPFIDWGHFRCPSRRDMLTETQELVNSGLDSVKVHKLIHEDALSEVSIKVPIEEGSEDLIGGYIDFVFPFDDGVVILDGKATKYGMKYLKETQLVWYALLWWRQHGVLPKKIGFWLYRHRPEDSMYEIEFNMSRVLALQQDIKRSFAEIRANGGSQKANVVAKHCQWCQWEDECEERQTKKSQRRAAREKRAPKLDVLNENGDLGL